MLKDLDHVQPRGKINKKWCLKHAGMGKDKEIVKDGGDRRRRSCIVHPLLQGPMEETSLPLRTASKSFLSEFTQRIMSGKLLQMKQHQNQLAEVQNRLQMSREENQALNRLLKRHEIALRRYEGENAGMPRLIQSHAEEVRALRMTVHQLKTELRQVQGQLKGKEAELISLKDAMAKLRALADQNKLFDLEKSHKKIVELEALREEHNRQIQLLSRQILLENKNHQRLLNAEVARHKDTRLKLEKALASIENLEKQKRALLVIHAIGNHPPVPPLKTPGAP